MRPEIDKAALLERLGGRRVVASISGGKDSASLGLLLKELGIEFDRVFMDTGWEHPATYAYVLPREAAFGAIAIAWSDWSEERIHRFLDEQERVYGEAPLQKALGPIHHLKPPLAMADLIRSKQMFPSGGGTQFCTLELKVKPMQAYLNARTDAGEDVVNAVGIRRGESVRRADALEWEWSAGFDCEVWRPLVEWTEADVILIHQKHGLRPNPLYLKGATRVGCWPCINANKGDIRLVAEESPERIATIDRLEVELNQAAQKRAAAKDAPAPAVRAWFKQKVGGVSTPVAIRAAVAWSRTSHGGTQFELFAGDPSDAGCMRWGLCERPTHAPTRLSEEGE
jgi:3'-phosphoadenosine 5'-phosphosulfate sulfotransferase (PAPS reductase)/FAD synthetase